MVLLFYVPFILCREYYLVYPTLLEYWQGCLVLQRLVTSCNMVRSHSLIFLVGSYMLDYLKLKGNSNLISDLYEIEKYSQLN